MNSKRLSLCVVAAALMISPPAAFSADPDCSGDGCDSLSFYWEAPCHKIRNIGNRPVKWTWGAFSGRLKPTESTAIINPFGGGCVQGIIGSRSAYLD